MTKRWVVSGGVIPMAGEASPGRGGSRRAPLDADAALHEDLKIRPGVPGESTVFVDTAIEAVGIPATFELCEQIVALGGTIANIGVHGTKVDLHLLQLWDRNITIATRLVDTVSTPMLLSTVRSRKIDPKSLITHRVKLERILDAYEIFMHAASTRALKVIIEA